LQIASKEGEVMESFYLIEKMVEWKMKEVEQYFTRNNQEIKVSAKFKLRNLFKSDKPQENCCCC
jgi:hypothetical protein